MPTCTNFQNTIMSNDANQCTEKISTAPSTPNSNNKRPYPHQIDTPKRKILLSHNVNDDLKVKFEGLKNDVEAKREKLRKLKMVKMYKEKVSLTKLEIGFKNYTPVTKIAFL